MTQRATILDAFQTLILAENSIPSLNAVAAAAGISKGGLMHHFPDRESLIGGLIDRCLVETDALMRAGAEKGKAAITWLELSALKGPELDTARALSILMPSALAKAVAISASVARWEQMISKEVGDPVLGEVIRLVGDGLLLNAVSTGPLSRRRVRKLAQHLGVEL